MRKNIILLCWLLFGALSPCCSCSADDGDGTVIDAVEIPVPLGDPFILLYNGTYYAYGTHGDQGIEVYTSDDLLTWKYKGLALNKEDSWADRWFWAPEVYFVNGKFYMYYSADEHICVATSNSPAGPFVQDVKKPMISDEKCIDNSLFIDDDGTPYLSFVRFNDGNNVWIAELEKDLVTLKMETMHPCLRVTEDWENVWPRVIEASYILKHNGLYYMTYSANSYESPFYGIGCATATDLMGTWTKYAENPLLQKPGALQGVGHSVMFVDKAGKQRIVFHAHNNKNNIHPRTMHIGEYYFEKVDGVDRLRISDKYITPKLVIGEEDTAGKYRNPVINYSLPDPTVIKADDGYFYLYATEDIRNLPIHRSKNLIDWEYVGTAFTGSTRPTFEPGGGLWAPDINKIGGKYVLYYSMSVWGGEWTCGIGCATADKPEGPFTDHGKMFRSNEINVQNSIDPFYIEEDGKKYLFWGSFSGIYAVELSDDGLAVKEGATPRQIAGKAYEGTYIHKKDGYYYLFASIGSCCEGLNSTYTTVVGRSAHLFGPYVDKKGNSMLENHHEVLIQKNSAFVGAGHNSEIVADDAGQDWFFYHAVSVKNPTGRVLMLDKVTWSNGWPVVEGNSPSTEAGRPGFGN